MEIIESLEPVIRQSKHVSVDKSKIKEFANRFDINNVRHWLTISPFDLAQLSEKARFGFLVALNSMSFSYWGFPKWNVEYRGRQYDGAQAMIACLGRAIDSSIILDPAFLADIKRSDLEKILKGNVEIPLLDDRLRILNEIGIITKQRFMGDFRYILDGVQGSALKLADLLVDAFPSYADSAFYSGKRVIFNKRAQLLASDISCCSGGLNDTDRLTACADYKVPQVLRRYGILQYSDELQKKIINGEEILAGSQMEVEIRANTIHAVELIKRDITKRSIIGTTSTKLTSNQINDHLWLEGQIKLQTDEPYHLTRTIAY